MHKSSQTDGFHHFFFTKRDSTTLFGLLRPVFPVGDPKKCRTVVPGALLGVEISTKSKVLGSWRLRGLILGLLRPSGGPPGTLLGSHFGPPGASWGSFWPSWGLLGFILALLRLILGLLGPPGAHFGASGALLGPPGVHSGPPRVHSGPPGASWGSFWASWSAPGALLARSWDLLGLILALLVRSGALGALLPSTRSTKLSQTPFEITVQKVSRLL